MEWEESGAKSRRGSGRGCGRAGAVGYQEPGRAAKPAAHSMRSNLATLGPKLSSSCSAVLGKSLGLSFPMHKMERTCLSN